MPSHYQLSRDIHWLFCISVKSKTSFSITSVYKAAKPALTIISFISQFRHTELCCFVLAQSYQLGLLKHFYLIWSYYIIFALTVHTNKLKSMNFSLGILVYRTSILNVDIGKFSERFFVFFCLFVRCIFIDILHQVFLMLLLNAT